MFRLAWRQLITDKIRSLITAIAVGAVVAVIMLLKGFELGQYSQLKNIVLNRGADLMIVQSGVENFTATRSSIPQLARLEVEAVDGVSSAHPLTTLPVIYNKDGLLTPVYLLVYDDYGGPRSLLQGHGIERGHEIVIDQSLAKKYQLVPGDTFEVMDFKFKVAGITRSAAFMMPFAFISYDGMIDLFIESDIAPDISTFPLLSYMLVKLQPGTNPQTVAHQIETQVSTVDVMTPAKLAESDVNLGKVFFKPIIGVLVSLGYVIGILVIALIMFTEVTSRLKSFAVLKALGFSMPKLMQGVIAQALLFLLTAFPMGVLLGVALKFVIEATAPVYFIEISSTLMWITTMGAIISFAFLGAALPLITLHRVDPILAFKGT